LVNQDEGSFILQSGEHICAEAVRRAKELRIEQRPPTRSP
jgi:hypothetical protein